MTLKGQVTRRVRVDACGQLIDTWEVDMTQQVVTSNAEWQITAVYDIATQYGGISVQDDVSIQGVNASNGASVITALTATPSGEIKGTISQLPKEES